MIPLGVLSNGGVEMAYDFGVFERAVTVVPPAVAIQPKNSLIFWNYDLFQLFGPIIDG